MGVGRIEYARADSITKDAITVLGQSQERVYISASARKEGPHDIFSAPVAQTCSTMMELGAGRTGGIT